MCRGRGATDNDEDNEMLTGIFITIIITTGLAYALRGGHRGGAITRRPYNNRYNPASGAREDAVLEAE
jgi:hypothetical protein